MRFFDRPHRHTVGVEHMQGVDDAQLGQQRPCIWLTLDTGPVVGDVSATARPSHRICNHRGGGDGQ